MINPLYIKNLTTVWQPDLPIKRAQPETLTDLTDFYKKTTVVPLMDIEAAESGSNQSSDEIEDLNENEEDGGFIDDTDPKRQEEEKKEDENEKGESSGSEAYFNDFDEDEMRLYHMKMQKKATASYYDLSVNELFEIEEGNYIINDRMVVEEEEKEEREIEYQREIPEVFLHNDDTEASLIRQTLGYLKDGGYYGRNSIYCKGGRSLRNDDKPPWRQPFFKEI